MTGKAKTQGVPLALPQPVILNWHALTQQAADEDAARLRAKGFPVLESRYRVVLLIDPVTQQNVLQAITGAVTEWKAKNPGYDTFQLVKGLEPGKDPDYPQHVTLEMKSKFPPYLQGPDGSPVPADTFYRGCIVGVCLSVRSFDAGMNKGLTLSCDSLKFIAQGEPLGGGGINPAVAQQRLASVPTTLPAGFNMPKAPLPAGQMVVDAPPARGL